MEATRKLELLNGNGDFPNIALTMLTNILLKKFIKDKEEEDKHETRK